MNTIDFYGADWCPDCQRAKAYLKEHDIDFNFIDVDIDKNATAKVEEINHGKRIIPIQIQITLHSQTFLELTSKVSLNSMELIGVPIVNERNHIFRITASIFNTLKSINMNGQQNWWKKPITENALSQPFSSTKNPIQIQIMQS